MSEEMLDNIAKSIIFNCDVEDKEENRVRVKSGLMAIYYQGRADQLDEVLEIGRD